MRSLLRCAGLLATGIFTIATTGPLVQSAQASRPFPPVVPSEIKVEAANKVFLVGHALGVQIYACTSTPTGFDWTFVAPRANLFNDRGKLIMTHFGGPTWQARDGSRVVGQLTGTVTVDRKAIPWLRLSAASTSAGPDGDELVDTTFIQRIATRGGLAPAVARCNKPDARHSGRSPRTRPTTSSTRRTMTASAATARLPGHRLAMPRRAWPRASGRTDRSEA